MSKLDINRTFSDGDILFEADLDNIKSDIETIINSTKLESENFQAESIIANTMLIDSTVTTSTIENSTISNNKFADSSITTAKIADSNITTAKLATDSVTTAKINDSAITTIKIKDSDVALSKINASAFTTAKIQDNGITDYTDFNTGAVTEAKIDGTSRTVSSLTLTNYTLTSTSSAGSPTYTDYLSKSSTYTSSGNKTILVQFQGSGSGESYIKLSKLSTTANSSDYIGTNITISATTQAGTVLDTVTLPIRMEYNQSALYNLTAGANTYLKIPSSSISALLSVPGDNLYNGIRVRFSIANDTTYTTTEISNIVMKVVVL